MRRFQRSGPPPDDSAAPSRTPGNLPAGLNRFVGRRTETTRLVERLRHSRLVSLTGVGGVGKTRLALHAAERVQDRFCSGGVWLVELSGARDREQLEHAVVAALGLSEASGRPPRAVLRGHLAERHTLLIMDGGEQLAEECAELAHDLLRHASGLRILSAARRPLEIGGEHCLPLGPMPDGEAADLFADRAAAVLPGFDRSGDRRAAVLALCHRLEGIPLAVELAAGRLRALSVGQITDRLAEDRFALLAGNARGVLPRHRSLRTTIGWSHELCTPEGRLLWARLSVFGGDFDLEAAEYLCSGVDLPAERVLPALTELIAQSVVLREEREDTAGHARYRLLETVREYGAQWLGQLADTDRLRRRHRDWYLGLGTWCELDWFSPRQAEVAARVEQELPNLRLALEYSTESSEDAHIGQYLAGTLWFFWIGCGRLREGRQWLELSLTWPGEQPEARAKALWATGLAAVLRGDTARALGALHECQELAEAHDDGTAAAYATQMLGFLALTGDDPARAKALLGEALERFGELGELNTLVILAQVGLAMTHALEGDTERALALAEEARDTAAGSGERWALSYALYALCHVHGALGENQRARTLNVACLTVKYEFGDALGMGMALEVLAALIVDDEPEQAAEMLGATDSGWGALDAWPWLPPLPLSPVSGDCRERALAATGEQRYTAAYRRGRELGLTALAAREIAARPGDPAAVLPSGQKPLRAAQGSAGRLPERGGGKRRPACPPRAGADGGQAG